MSNVDTVTRRDSEAVSGASVTKSTVIIPDELLIEAKSFAVTAKTSVQELLIAGLRRELAARKDPEREQGDTAPAEHPAGKR